MEPREKAIGLIAEILEIDVLTLTGETMIRDVPNWDSLAQLQIIGEMEDAFHISIPIEEMKSIKTVKDLLNYLK